MRLRHKPWADALISEHPEVALTASDIKSEPLPFFDCLEIGSGCGGFLLGQALRCPDQSYLGIEINRNAFAIAVKKLLTTDPRPENLHFLNADCDTVLPLIKDSSLTAIFLNFNDPWPKAKHHKRRLTAPERLAQYYRILMPGGELLFKTDNDDYYRDSIGYFNCFGKFKAEFIEDYQSPEPTDVMSEYELKFRSRGQMIHRIRARKEK